MKDDPTYTGGTRVKSSSVNVAKYRGALSEQKEQSVERDVATPPGEESREGTLSHTHTHNKRRPPNLFIEWK